MYRSGCNGYFEKKKRKKKKQKEIHDEEQILNCVNIDDMRTIKLKKSNKIVKECEESGNKKRRSGKKKNQCVHDNENDCHKKLTIRPSMETRGKILADRHLLCLSEGTVQLESTNPEDDIKRYQQLPNKKISKMKKKKSEKGGTERRSKKPEDDARTTEETEHDDFESNDKDETDKKHTRKKVDKKKKKKVKRISFGSENRRNDVESSECDTVCSFDSEICLAGLTLTVEDERKIRKNLSKTVS